jgi:hypothetical protein
MDRKIEQIEEHLYSLQYMNEGKSVWYICEYCNYATQNMKNYDSHLLTNKHCKKKSSNFNLFDKDLDQIVRDNRMKGNNRERKVKYDTYIEYLRRNPLKE